MGLHRVSQTSIALLRAGEEFDQGCSLQRKSLRLLLQPRGDTAFPSAGDEPGLSDTLVDDGAAWKSEEKHRSFVTEPGHGGELELSLGFTSEMNSTGSTAGVGGEGGQGVVSSAHQGLLLLFFLFSVVGT